MSAEASQPDRNHQVAEQRRNVPDETLRDFSSARVASLAKPNVLRKMSIWASCYAVSRLANCTCICTHRHPISTQPPLRLRFIFPCNCLIFIKLVIDNICAREPPPPAEAHFRCAHAGTLNRFSVHCSWVKQARHHLVRALVDWICRLDCSGTLFGTGWTHPRRHALS